MSVIQALRGSRDLNRAFPVASVGVCIRNKAVSRNWPLFKLTDKICPLLSTKGIAGSGRGFRERNEDLSGNLATVTARANPSPVTPYTFGGGCASRYGPKAPKADVPPSVSAQVVRGGVAGLPAFPRRLVPRHIVQASQFRTESLRFRKGSGLWERPVSCYQTCY